MVFKTDCVGSIPATLDIVVKNFKRRKIPLLLKKTKATRPWFQHTRFKTKHTTFIFFSYTRPLPSYKLIECLCPVDWINVCKHPFHTIFSLSQGVYLWNELNYTTLRHMFSSPTPFKSRAHGRELNTQDIPFLYSSGTAVSSSFRWAYFLQQTQAYLDLILNLWFIQKFQILLLPFGGSNRFVWANNTFVLSCLALQGNVQRFNLTSKALLRRYFKFHNYWFEYFRLAHILQLEVFIPFSIFLHDDIVSTTKISFLNRSTRLSSPNTTLFKTQLSLNYDLSKNLYVHNRILVKPRCWFYTQGKHTETGCTLRITRRELLTSPYIYSNRRLFFTKFFPIRLSKDHRQRKRNQRHKHYSLRNKSWQSIFKTHRSYSTTFKLSRKFRQFRLYRKFVPRTIRTISMYSPRLQHISYRALVNNPKLAYLLTSDSSRDTLTVSYRQRLPQIPTFYSLLVHHVQVFTRRWIPTVAMNRRPEVKLFTPVSSVSSHLILQFTTRESFATLVIHNNTVLWKYSLHTSAVLASPYFFYQSSNQFFTNVAQMIMYIVQIQGYLYDSTYTRQYLLHSNLSLLQLEEFYSSVLTHNRIDSKVLRYYSTRYMRPSGFLWYYTSLIQFLEYTTGRKIALNFGPFLETAITFTDRAKCLNWKSRLLGFQRILGPKIFIYEALEVLVVSIRLKDPTFLANWIRAMLARISFWKYRVIFRYLKFLLQNLIKPSFNYFSFKGAKFRLKGKISVAGNARTRMVFYRIGSTSHTTMAHRISYDLSYVHTFTGIQGFKIWFFY